MKHLLICVLVACLGIAQAAYMVTFSERIGCQQSKLLNETCFRVRKCYRRRILVDVNELCDADGLWKAFSVEPEKIVYNAPGFALSAGTPWFASGRHSAWASEAWAKGVNGSESIIAILDDGLFAPAIAPGYVERVVDGYDFCTASHCVSEDGDGRDNDPSAPYADNHGTLCALAATGVAKGVAIMPIRIASYYQPDLEWSDVADAIIYAAGGTIDGVPPVAKPASVISISWGGYTQCNDPYNYDFLIDAFNFARQKGVIIVAAAGNENLPATALLPANCPGAISVGASTIAGKIASFSNTHFHIAAPGHEIPVTIPNGAGGAISGVWSGTSAAAPIAAATMVLGMDARMYGKGFVSRPTTEKWDYDHPECISKGIISFKGDPMNMQACAGCGGSFAIAMHYVEDTASGMSALTWVLMVFWIVVLFWVVYLIAWGRCDQPWYRMGYREKDADESPRYDRLPQRPPPLNPNYDSRLGAAAQLGRRSVWEL